MSAAMPTLDDVLVDLHRLGDREKGSRFELMCAWLLLVDPQFSAREVFTWEQWREHELIHDRDDPRGDTGIDLVAVMEDDQLWAVQAKCYGEIQTVPTSEIDKFVARAADGNFARLLLIATTDHVAEVGRHKLLNARPSGHVMRLEDLRALERDDWPAVGQPLRSVCRLPLPMRPHQIAAMRDVVERGFATGQDRGQLLMACGTGKTLVGQRIAEKLRSDRTLVVVPSLSLLEQTHRAWKANATRRFRAFCFCSDPSVAGREGDDADRDVASVTVPVHTDPAELRAFLARADRNGQRVVVFATYQSLDRLVEMFAGLEPIAPFDLLIADEAHRSAGPAQSTFGLVCDDRQLLAERRLFMTATARVVTGATDVDLVLSMDNAARYGPVFHHLKFSDAIEQDLLCDYQVLVIAADPGEHVRLVERHRIVSTAEHAKVDAHALAVELAVAHAMERDGLRRVLTFHSRVRGARRFARGFPVTVEWRGGPGGRLWTKAVSGEMPAGQRRMFLRRLGRLDDCDRAVLSNARCFGEGVDVPAIDAVVFVDPRESVIDIVQAVGRTMRTSPGTDKRIGTIVVPVLVDGEDAGELIESTKFATVWRVLTALRAHDDRLNGYLTDLLRARIYGGDICGGFPHLEFELPTITVGEEFARAFSARAVDATTDSFERGLAELAAYVEAGGRTTRIPREYRTPTGLRLGLWCHARRNERRKGKLSAQRIAVLDALGFVWEPNRDRFAQGLAELAQYIRTFGSGRISADYVAPSGFELGVWCAIQRTQRNADRLSEDRIARLDELGFIWDQLLDDFDAALAELAAYAETHGDAKVPQDYETADGFKLGDWCVERRKRRRLGKLQQDRTDALDALGFVWEPLKDIYDRGLAELRAYVDKHGDARVPDGYRTESGYDLAKWCAARRRERKVGKLDPQQVAVLEELGFSWNPLQEDYQRGLTELAAYAAQHGTAQVPAGHQTASGFTLGTWCAARRGDWKAGRLSAERKAQLDALGFAWDPFRQAFGLGLAELSDYILAHGDANVPRSYVTGTGFDLGKWCSRRRDERKRGKLNPERVTALESLGFKWDSGEDPFERGLAELIAYRDRHGHARVPAGHRTPSGFGLGGWCGSRRQDRRAGRLPDDRAAQLDAIGFAWNPHQDLFDRGLIELAAYVQAHGDARVSQSYTTPDGYHLGTWCAARRKDLQADRLAPERAKALTDLGLEAELPDPFEVGISELVDYVHARGDALVSSSYAAPSGYNLGKWCSHQRDDRKTGRLSPERTARLDELGFVWDAVQNKFDTGLAALRTYVATHGDALVKQGYHTLDGFALGTWCSERRTDYRLGRLSDERVAILEALGFAWSKHDATFNAAVSELATYAAEHGNTDVPRNYVTPTGLKLGAWCRNRRNERQAGQLSDKRIAGLDALGFEW
jgi:superfamily II DNA or RNA helicase